MANTPSSLSDVKPARSVGLITIVIPTRNESEDISGTLEACLALDDPAKEILVIDDSVDDTPDVARMFADRGVRVFHRTRNSNGCCGARNEGIRRAAGEIVVLLNADARPAPDFLMRIRRHYEDGAGYVVVRSEVENRESAWSRLLAVEEDIWFLGGRPMEWSEGFSCRLDAAQAIGGIPGDFPVPFCRDWRLGEALGRAGFRKVTDLTIRVPHRAPDRFATFWRNQVWRGTMVAPSTHYLGQRTLAVVAARESARALRTVVRLAVLAPLWRSIWMCRKARVPARAIPGLALAATVREVAFSVGALHGTGRVLRAPRQRQNDRDVIMNINTRAYWSDRFAGGTWRNSHGQLQTAHFANDICTRLALPREFTGTILDFGCATGDAMPVYKAHYPLATLLGVDFADAAIVEACRTYGHLATFMVGSIDAVPHVDVIIASNVLEHLDADRDVAEKLLSRCRTLAIAVPYRERLPLGRGEHVNSYDKQSFHALKPSSVQVYLSRGWSQYGFRDLVVGVYLKNIARFVTGRPLAGRRRQALVVFDRLVATHAVPSRSPEKRGGSAYVAE